MSIYKDKKYSFEQRAKDLLSKMTVREKINQMHVYGSGDVQPLIKDINDGKKFVPFGGMFNICATKAEDLSKLQRYAMEETRLGIPILFFGEGLHGLFHPNANVFPQVLGLSCSFDLELIEDISREIGSQAKKGGFGQLFAPNLDLVREIRWGRVQETYGEDTFLIEEMGSASVRGLQSQGIASTLKHFVAHGTPENGLNLSSVHVGEREIRETMLPPFEKCIKEGALSVMPAYHEMDGVPLHASKKWVNDVLRDELGFSGTVISDWGGINMLNIMHHTAKDQLESGKQAINAGVDIEAPDYYGYGDQFMNAVESGEIDIDLIDRAVYRILLLKFRLGLFDNKEINYVDNFRTDKGVALAKKAADESIVLLKNDGLLPLNKDTKIAIIGPNANLMQLGSYTYCGTGNRLTEDCFVTPYQGLKNVFSEKNVKYAKGCGITGGTQEDVDYAINVAKESDVVVLALGDNSMFFGGVGWGDGDEKIKEAVTCGEGFDLASLTLTKPQKELFDQIKNLGKKIVLVLFTGRPMAIVDEFNSSNAVIQAWYPGEQGGNSLADILVGKVNPSGKLTTSFPRSTGHIPCNYNHRVSARGCWYKNPGSYEVPGRDYVFDLPSAFLPFGYGLSYTTFEYSDLSLSTSENGEIEVIVNIKNTGDCDGDEIALLFVKKHSCPFVPYEKELKAFKRVSLKAGEQKRVKLSFNKDALSYVGEDYKKTAYSGIIDIMVQDKKVEIEIK